jgi:CheY-like chemotaxis protein
MSATILIVEDDAPIQQMYAAKLRLHGYTILTANNGIEGLEQYNAHHPDLILLDLMMPKMSGDEMLQRLREKEFEDKATELTKVIVLTNISRDEAPPSLRFLKVEQFIVKAQYTPSQVLAIIQEVLNN